MLNINLSAFRRIYLNDLDLENPHGEALSDDDLAQLLRAATAEFEREFAVRLTPTVVRLGAQPLKTEPPSRAAPPEGATPEEIEALPPLEHFSALTYDPRSFEGSRHVNLQLPIGPVRVVHGAGLELPGRPTLLEFPSHAVQVNERRKRIQIYWKAGFAQGPPFALSGLGIMALNSSRSIPNAWHVAYEAGYTPEDLAGRDADVLEALQKMVAIKALVIGSADRNFAMGVTGRTVSVDALSQTTNLAANADSLKYGALIKAYGDDLQAFKSMYSQRKSGVRLSVL